VFGNPLRLDGRFPQCFPGGRFAGMWKSIHVDSRTVSLSNKESLDEKIGYYGPESNYVRSHILGQFPTASNYQLIPVDTVEMAALRDTTSAKVSMDVPTRRGSFPILTLCNSPTRSPAWLKN
jgi:hypothetical protein